MSGGMWELRRLYQQTRWRVSASSTVGDDLLRLLRYVTRRKRRPFAEEKIFHVLGDEILGFLLPRHQPVLVEDHLHPILPELPGRRRDVVVDPLPELARPRRRVEAGELLLKLLAEHHPPALVADRQLRRVVTARISHDGDCTGFHGRTAPPARRRSGTRAPHARPGARGRRQPGRRRARRGIRDSWTLRGAAPASDRASR